MAQVRAVRLIDDLNGEPADETVEFGFGGRDYEIDLSRDNAEALRDGLKPFIAAARVKRRASSSTSAAKVRRADRTRNQTVRDWARGQGIEVSDRGRIPENVLAAYKAGHVAVGR